MENAFAACEHFYSNEGPLTLLHRSFPRKGDRISCGKSTSSALTFPITKSGVFALGEFFVERDEARGPSWS